MNSTIRVLAVSATLALVAGCSKSKTAKPDATPQPPTSVPSAPSAWNDKTPVKQGPATLPSGGAKTPGNMPATGAPARPSNQGGPGPALAKKGNPKAGATVYAKNCAKCHGAQGKGGKKNPGSDDGTVPALAPIDPTIKSANPKEFATNLDLFIEHGSTPAGKKPSLVMPAFGDKKKLNPQQIADVIAYVESLNK